MKRFLLDFPRILYWTRFQPQRFIDYVNESGGNKVRSMLSWGLVGLILGSLLGWWDYTQTHHLIHAILVAFAVAVAVAFAVAFAVAGAVAGAGAGALAFAGEVVFAFALAFAGVVAFAVAVAVASTVAFAVAFAFTGAFVVVVVVMGTAVDAEDRWVAAFIFLLFLISWPLLGIWLGGFLQIAWMRWIISIPLFLVAIFWLLLIFGMLGKIKMDADSQGWILWLSLIFSSIAGGISIRTGTITDMAIIGGAILFPSLIIPGITGFVELNERRGQKKETVKLTELIGIFLLLNIVFFAASGIAGGAGYLLEGLRANLWFLSACFFLGSVLITGLPWYPLELLLFRRQLHRADRFVPKPGISFLEDRWRRSVLFQDRMLLLPLPGVSRFLQLIARYEGIEQAVKEIRFVYEDTFQARQAEKAIRVLAADSEVAFQYYYWLLTNRQFPLLSSLAHSQPLARAYWILLGRERKPAEQSDRDLPGLAGEAGVKRGWFRLSREQKKEDSADETERLRKSPILDRILYALSIFEQHAHISNADEVIEIYRLFEDALRVRTGVEIGQLAGGLRRISQEPFSLYSKLKEDIAQLAAIAERLGYISEAVRMETRRQFLYAAGNALSGVVSENIKQWPQPEARIGQAICKRWQSVISQELAGLRPRADIRVEILNTKVNMGEAASRIGLRVTNVGESAAEGVRILLDELSQRNNMYEIKDGTASEFSLIETGQVAEAVWSLQPKQRGRARLAGQLLYNDPEANDKPIPFGFELDIGDFMPAFKHIPNNPYITGNPVHTPEMFFGRQDVLEFLRANLRGKYQKNTIVLFGQRRTGKTSILLKVQQNGLKDSQLLPVFLDMQGVTNTADLFRNLASKIQASLSSIGLRVALPPAPRDDPFGAFKEFCDELVGRIKDCRIVLMIDEFESLEERVKAGKIEKSVFEHIRHLMQHYEPIIFVFCGTHRLEEMRQDYWGFLFNIALYHRVSFLDEPSARELITRPVAGALNYDELAADRLYTLTNGQPYLLQLLCHHLVNYMNEKKERNYITLNEVEAVVDRITQEGNPYFIDTWNGCSLEEQAVLSALAGRMEALKRDFLDFDTLIWSLKEVGWDLSRQRFMKQLEQLSAREILKETQMRYCFSVPLLGQWAARKYPLWKLRQAA